jgi:hypothetical protein
VDHKPPSDVLWVLLREEPQKHVSKVYVLLSIYYSGKLYVIEMKFCYLQDNCIVLNYKIICWSSLFAGRITNTAVIRDMGASWSFVTMTMIESYRYIK